MLKPQNNWRGVDAREAVSRKVISFEIKIEFIVIELSIQEGVLRKDAKNMYLKVTKILFEKCNSLLFM